MSTSETAPTPVHDIKATEETPVATENITTESQAPAVPADKPILPTTVVEPTTTTSTEPESKPINVTGDKIEAAPVATETVEDVTPPAPIAKETAEEKKVEDKSANGVPAAAATAAPATPSSKKEKKGLLARISGIFGISSPEKKDKVHKAETPVASTSKAIPAIPTETADKPTTTETAAPTATPSVPTTVETTEPVKVDTPVAETDKLVEGVQGLNIAEQSKKDVVDVSEPVETPAATAALPVPGADVQKEEPVVKSSPSTPKMHRRISARIGQYIDTRFGDKKEKSVSTKKETPVVDGAAPASGDESKIDETPVVKIDEAPVLAAPIAVEPLGEVSTSTETPIIPEQTSEVVKPVAATV